MSDEAKSQVSGKPVWEIVADLQSRLDKSLTFKTFVHTYLNRRNIPHGDPENQHQKEGCRIGARLDLVFAQLTAAQARVKELEQCLERERVLLKGLKGNLKACEEHNEELILEKRERVETVRKVSEALDAIDRNELLRERVELVKDKERLDWLQSTKPLMVAPMFPNDKWDIAIIESGNETHDSDVRAAIDAAIAKEKKV